MTDLLDETPVPRASRRQKRKAPRVLGVVVVLVIVVALTVTAAYGVGRLRSHFQSAPDYSGSGSGRAVVQVKPGESAYRLATRLADMGIVKSAAAFRKAANGNSKASSLQPGFYQLHVHMSAASALALLLDPNARLLGHVTIPEGSTENQTLALIAKNTEVPLADLKQAAGNPAALGLPAYAGGHLEGFLFPATYDIQPGTGAVEVLTMMVQRFEESAAANGLVQRSKALGLTPYQVVTVASLIERESRLQEEYPKVSRVVYNRLAKHMTLGIDAAILYGLGRTSGVLHASELAKDTPYNTRLHAGLPPTPIASPGDAALEGALNPAPGDWLYYVLADKDGHQLFTSSYQEFLRQVAKSKAEGIF
ncbi:MAG: putative periplasmic solute-binding protein [Frankiales bacterium]|nr:putative periplasmic solute-binding protein [Frankiales bacterium]